MRRPPARRPRRLAIALTALAAACGGSDDGRAVTVVDVAAQPCDRPTRSFGVGVVVADGIVATAAHTVEGALRELTVDGTPAQVLSVDARTDLALLATAVPGTPATVTLDEIDHGTVRTPDGDHQVDVLRTGRLIVHDVTDGVRHARSVHTLSPGVDSGTSGAPLTDDAGRVAGIVVLTNRTDGTAYAVTTAELLDLLLRLRPSPTRIACPG